MTAVWDRIAANSKARILQFNFPVWDDRIFGDFGAKTETAVKAYQHKMGLVEDGVVGAWTWTALLKG